MLNNDYCMLRYANLQQRSRKAYSFNDYAWGIGNVPLNYYSTQSRATTVPSNPLDLDATLSRAIASGARALSQPFFGAQKVGTSSRVNVD